VLEMGGAAAGLAEVAGAKLVVAGDDGCTHGTVFVGSLGPGEAGGSVDPEGESHSFMKAWRGRRSGVIPL
jgi:hypothetical protein